ncbi:lysine-specific demethylase 8-like [Lineus longissimus]|uniref:lysine-specific demethylase 8-like n=1 Tax=Lineus longissimus TaxID=88925 RepID=UPI002B4EBB1A
MALKWCESIPIKRVKNLNKLDFEKDYLHTGQPVIIEGAVEHWPAKHWTLDNLCQRVGSNQCLVRGNTNREDYRLGKKYTIRETTLQEYVDDLLKENSRSKNSYLAVQNLNLAFPELQDDVPLPEYVGKIHCGPYMWIARKGHYEYCHTDPDDNFLVMIKGTKQLRLFGLDTEHMYPNIHGSKGKTLQSQINVEEPDLEKFPEFKNATCHHCVLSPGEMLFIPAFWWHQVTSLDVCISINMFFGDAGENIYLEKLMKPPFWPVFSYWLLNLVEQNRGHESFFQKMLSRLPDVLRNFLLKQWHEVPTDEQLDVLVATVKDYLKIDTLPEPEISSAKHPPQLKIRGLLWR